MHLSNSEAEWVASSEAVKESVFIIQLLQSMKVSVKLPITVRVGILGTIFTAGHVTASKHMKNVDIKYEYVN